MLIFLIVLIVVLSLLLIASILLQDDKSGGGMGIVGGSSQSFFGASSDSFLQRFTAIGFTLFVILVIGTALYISKTSGITTIDEKTARDAEQATYKTIVNFENADSTTDN